jgi:N-acetylglucosamine-6-phosphate deacetylase
MQNYIIAGCSAVLPDRIEKDATVVIEGGRIGPIGGEIPKGAERIDARGLFLVPGFIDIHCHGGGGADSWEDPVRFAKAHANFGTTGILSTIAYSVSHGNTVEGIKKAVAAMENGEAPTLLGIHLEGPYTNPKYGASREGVRGPNPEEYAEYLAAAKGSIKIWTFAPEVEGAERFVRDVKDSGLAPGVVFSVGHSEAEPEVVYRHIPDGLALACHLMDAMGVTPGESRYGGTREVGVTEAVLLEDAITAEVIPDSWGAHVRPLNLKLIVKTKSVSARSSSPTR